MLRPAFTTQFKRDVKKMIRRGKDESKLKTIIEKLIHEEPLDFRQKDHWLLGEYRNRRECHIEPDWLLIYFPQKNEIIFERTGTHADLFR